MSKFLESWLKERERVIIFSGVFDPVHKGHLAAASKASNTCGRQVVFLPERAPIHKHGSTDFKHRVAMLELACKNNKNFLVLESPYEHHTVSETLTWIKGQFPENQNFGLLIGGDVAEYIMEWSNIKDLPSYGIDKIIIANRVTRDMLGTFGISISGVNTTILRARYNYMASSIIRTDFGSYQTSVPASITNYAIENNLYK